MASHLDCIGLGADSKDEFQQLLSNLADDAEKFDAPNGGTLLAWQDASGASIYIHVNADNTFQCATPSFLGATQHRVRPTGIAADEACPICDVLQVELLDKDEQMYYPLLLQLEDMEIARPRIVLKTPCQLRVAGFAERAEFWPTENAFLESQTRKPKFAAQSFIPSGMFSNPPTPHAVLTGKILEAGVRTNSKTNGRFLHLRVDSFGGEYDIVSTVPAHPVGPGAVIQCTCWMVGRIVNPATLT